MSSAEQPKDCTSASMGVSLKQFIEQHYKKLVPVLDHLYKGDHAHFYEPSYWGRAKRQRELQQAVEELKVNLSTLRTGLLPTEQEIAVSDALYQLVDSVLLHLPYLANSPYLLEGVINSIRGILNDDREKLKAVIIAGEKLRRSNTMRK